MQRRTMRAASSMALSMAALYCSAIESAIASEVLDMFSS